MLQRVVLNRPGLWSAVSAASVLTFPTFSYLTNSLGKLFPNAKSDLRLLPFVHLLRILSEPAREPFRSLLANPFGVKKFRRLEFFSGTSSRISVSGQ